MINIPTKKQELPQIHFLVAEPYPAAPALFAVILLALNKVYASLLRDNRHIKDRAVAKRATRMVRLSGAKSDG
jgi:hypothetical protein